jgi:choline dehydrogenase-like flavoprotein
VKKTAARSTIDLSPSEQILLEAVINRIIPADRDPSGTGFGADRFVVAMLASDSVKDSGLILDGLSQVNAASRRRFGLSFAELQSDRQDELLRLAENQDWFRVLVTLASEGVYADPDNGGNRDAASWRMIGYRHGIPEGPSGPPWGRPAPVVAPPWEPVDYDVIVVGAGAGGGVAACVLAEAGKSVLLLERGYALDYASNGHRDHLRNQWLPRYGHNAGPHSVGNPRVFVSVDGAERVVAPYEPDYQNVGAGLGSATVFYGGQAWRFHPDDFRMSSRYGVPEGSSLVDWPIGYEELAPWYARAEREIGVAGSLAVDDDRTSSMPPHAGNEASHILSRGAAKLGISTVTPPLLINSRPHDGRPACIACGSCLGFPCPVDAKNGTHNTVIPRAINTGRCKLITGATAERVEMDRTGKAIGIAYIGDTGVRSTVRSRAVVLSCGAIETARLLLLSACSSAPDGIGNSEDLVGRNLQGHVYPTAFGLFEVTVQESRGPGVTIATCDYVHGNKGIVGGAMLADDFVLPPVAFWHRAWPPGVPRWGQAAKDFMRDHYRHVLQVKGPVHEIPNPLSRVTLDRATVDSCGLAVARISGSIHVETLRAAHFIYDKEIDWLEASGAISVWGERPRLALSAHSHQAGTCRMGTDPRRSVTDPYGRIWGHKNLFIADAALHPTNGAFNPVLTIMALAFRNSDHIARSI